MGFPNALTAACIVVLNLPRDWPSASSACSFFLPRQVDELERYFHQPSNTQDQDPPISWKTYVPIPLFWTSGCSEHKPGANTQKRWADHAKENLYESSRGQLRQINGYFERSHRNRLLFRVTNLQYGSIGHLSIQYVACCHHQKAEEDNNFSTGVSVNWERPLGYF